MTQDTMVQAQGGTCIALLAIVQAMIAAHPNRAAVALAIREILDGDVPVLVAMQAAGKPKIDEAFRETMEGVLKFAEQPPQPVRFPRFGTGAGC